MLWSPLYRYIVRWKLQSLNQIFVANKKVHRPKDHNTLVSWYCWTKIHFNCPIWLSETQFYRIIDVVPKYFLRYTQISHVSISLTNWTQPHTLYYTIRNYKYLLENSLNEVNQYRNHHRHYRWFIILRYSIVFKVNVSRGCKR